MASVGRPGYLPNAPQTVAVRPLVKGMISEGHSALAPPDSFRVVKGFDVGLTGLRRSGGFAPIATSPITLMFNNAQAESGRRLSERVEDFTVLVGSDGTPVGLTITNRMLYTFDPATGFTPVPWSAASYTIKSYSVPVLDGWIVVDTDITGVDIAADDWIQFDTDTTSTLWKVTSIDYNVSTVGDTTIKIQGGPAVVTATTFKVFKPFKTAQDEFLDWTTGRNGFYAVDGITTFVFKFETLYLTSLKLVASSTDSRRTMYTAKTICYFKDRLWFGNTVEPLGGGSVKPLGRIRWTDVLTWSYSAAGDYSDQDYKSGQLQKLVGADQLLLAFATDAIYYGQQSGLAGLPYAFYQLQTGGMSLSSPKAVGQLLGGCIFVGPDDVYTVFMTDAGPVVERVGLAVANRLIGDATDRKLTTVKVDPMGSRVVVGTSEGGGSIDALWCWNYKTKGWSKIGAKLKEDQYTLAVLAVNNYVDQLSIGEVPETSPGWTFDTSPFAGVSFDSLLRTMIGVDVFAFDANGYLYKFTESVSNHTMYVGLTATAVPIKVELETQDLDFERPDDVKIFTELSVQLDDSTPVRTAAIRLYVEGSTDRGRSWRSLGALRFGVGDDEDKINFRMTGDNVRFRLTSNDIVEPWTLLGYTVRVKTRTNREAQRGTTRS